MKLFTTLKRLVKKTSRPRRTASGSRELDKAFTDFAMRRGRQALPSAESKKP